MALGLASLFRRRRFPALLSGASRKSSSHFLRRRLFDFSFLLFLIGDGARQDSFLSKNLIELALGIDSFLFSIPHFHRRIGLIDRIVTGSEDYLRLVQE